MRPAFHEGKSIWNDIQVNTMFCVESRPLPGQSQQVLPHFPPQLVGFQHITVFGAPVIVCLEKKRRRSNEGQLQFVFSSHRPPTIQFQKEGFNVFQ
jgi:hypothetical protein